MAPINHFIRKTGVFLSKNAPTIMTMVGIIGVPATGVAAFNAYPKYEKLKMEAEEEKGDSLGYVELATATWRAWATPAVLGLCTMASIFGANHVHLRRNALLAGLYTASEATLREYQRRVVDTIGRTKEEGIRADINHDKITAEPPGSPGKEVIVTGHGKFLVQDGYVGRYFESSVEKINQTVNEINRRITTGMEMYASLNDFYEDLSLEPTPAGEMLGWNIDNLCSVIYTTSLSPKNEPCLVLDYGQSVVLNFKDIMFSNRRNS